MLLSVEGVLNLSVDGNEVHVEARGNTLRLDVDRPRAFFRALGATRAGVVREQLRRLARLLAESGLTLRVVSRNRDIVILGRDAAPGAASRVLGVPHLALGRAGDLLRALAD